MGTVLTVEDDHAMSIALRDGLQFEGHTGLVATDGRTGLAMAEVFLEVMVAAPVLAICGGGPVGQALARAAALAGFECLVADDRPEFRRPETFPSATRFAAVDRDPGDVLPPMG